MQSQVFVIVNMQLQVFVMLKIKYLLRRIAQQRTFLTLLSSLFSSSDIVFMYVSTIHANNNNNTIAQ